jgi:hypothetical protein
MQTQGKSKPDSDPRQAAEHVAGAHTLLKTLQGKVAEHPEIGQAIHKLEMALAILEVKSGGLLYAGQGVVTRGISMKLASPLV